MKFFFLFILKAISNFEMDAFGSNYQARVFPEGKQNFFLYLKNNFYLNILVAACLFISMICCAFVHRVCVTTW